MDKIKFKNGSTIESIGKDGKYTDSDIAIHSVGIKTTKPIKKYYIYSYQNYNGYWEKFLLKSSDRLIHSIATTKNEAIQFTNKKAARIWLKNLKKKWNEYLKEKFSKGSIKIYKLYKKSWYKSTKYRIKEEDFYE